MLQSVCGSLHGLTHGHVEALRRFAAEAQSGKTLCLPGGVVARREFAWLVLAPILPPSEHPGFSYAVDIPGVLAVPELNCTYHFKILNRDDPGSAYNEAMRAGLDPQKLGGELILRNWRAGDTFYPLGSRGDRKLKELFRERKIPEVQRKVWPVLSSKSQILWVRGFPPGSLAAATDATRRVLIVEEEATPLP
jgi:tRNA(Ile)-lysidine synthase